MVDVKQVNIMPQSYKSRDEKQEDKRKAAHVWITRLFQSKGFYTESRQSQSPLEEHRMNILIS
jgi:hypothetical protein